MAAALRTQAEACARLGSPFMARLLGLLARNWPEHTGLARFCNGFRGDIGPSGHSLPLRLASALHALALRGKDPLLTRVYPPNEVSDAMLNNAAWITIARHEAFVLDWMRAAPQTNEVRRSAALIAAAHWLAARYGLPFVTSELGASAGLNLIWDRYALDTDKGSLGPDDPVLYLVPDWEGDLPFPAQVNVRDRAGVDLNPLDTTNPDHRLRLLSYIWPDQPYRMELTRAAMSAHPGPVAKGDAIDWLQTRLARPRPGALHLIYHTIAWQYFPQDTQERGTALIEAAGAVATSAAPLAWLSVEDDKASPGAGIHLRLWPGNERIALGRMDFHGRWVRWHAPLPT